MEIGDIVRLKNGGPRMTVVRAVMNLARCEVDAECNWFVDDLLQTAVFPQVVLETVEVAA